MSRYFNYFPKLISSQNNSAQIVTNIIARVEELNSLKNNSLVYYQYSIQESDTPEIIADKYYGDPEKHWIILLTNDIQDPFFDWPMPYQIFADYVENKYLPMANTMAGQTGTAWAQSNIQAYQKVISSTDAASGNTTVRTYSVDANTYNTIVSQTITTALNTVKIDKSTLSYYDYEVNLNESKRTIFLLNSSYVDQIMNELITLMGQ